MASPVGELWRGISAGVQGNIGARKGQLGWKRQEGLQVCIGVCTQDLGLLQRQETEGQSTTK